MEDVYWKLDLYLHPLENYVYFTIVSILFRNSASVEDFHWKTDLNILFPLKLIFYELFYLFSNSATDTVEQELMFVGQESGKLLAMRQIILKGFQPPVLVFVQSKDRAKELFNELIYDGLNVDVIHADRTQTQVNTPFLVLQIKGSFREVKTHNISLYFMIYGRKNYGTPMF